MWQSANEFLRAIHFMHPGWLWVMPLSFAVFAYLMYRNQLRPLARVPQMSASDPWRHPRLGILRQLHARVVQQQMARGAFFRWAGYGVLLVCVHLALAQPYRFGRQLPTPPEYRDTVFVVDTSISMELRDYLIGNERVDRMTILKSALTHFIEQLKGNRISLIVFSEQPYTLVPFTADYALLKTQVRRLRPAVLTGRTTDVSKALLYTLQQLQRTGADRPGPKPVVVLITDVDRTYRDTDPRAVAAYLHQQGYRLHTIGIGASSYAAREKNVQGLIYQPANFTLLQAIARRGGGQFYRADNAGSLASAIRAIQSAERRPEKVEPRFITIPLYAWPLLAGLFWVMGLQLGATMRRRS
jgi:Ca-activated chloride channel family protein